jgi:hypothetical protein
LVKNSVPGNTLLITEDKTITAKKRAQIEVGRTKPPSTAVSSFDQSCFIPSSTIPSPAPNIRTFTR